MSEHDDGWLEQGYEEAVEEVEKLKQRWDSLKDIFQLTIDNYEDNEDLDLSFARAVLKDMEKLEKE